MSAWVWRRKTRLISSFSFFRYLPHHNSTSNLPHLPSHVSRTLVNRSMDMDTSNHLSSRFTHRARVLPRTCRTQITLTRGET
jgi:hypothetical protein